MKQLIPDTKLNRDYFIVGRSYVLKSTDSGKSVDALLLYIEDDKLCFIIIGRCEDSSDMEAQGMYISKEQIEEGTTVISEFDPMRFNMVEVLAEIGVPVTESETDMHRRSQEQIGQSVWNALDELENGIKPARIEGRAI